MKEIYRKLCSDEPSIPLFSQAWWLDAVAGDNWDVCLVEKGGVVVASMPYTRSSRLGMTVISKPALTQTLGPWIRPTNAKYAKQLSTEKELMGMLIDQLPEYAYFNQTWHHSMQNWLPFFWRGFEQTTRYTYVIEDLSDIDYVWANLQENIRREIRKATNKVKLKVRTDLSIDDFIALNKMTFSRQGKAMPYSPSFIIKMVTEAKKRNQCQWFIAQDDKGQNHAGVLIIWDEQSAYYLMGGGNPELRNSGATSLCMWEAIKFSSTVTQRFDFEGSMIEPIERFFRGFGAVQTPYSMLTHVPSKRFRLLKLLRELINR
ncbi:GNAT family N-acetyltransferase [Amphritea sp. 1_MG-2023]|uniref:GNAT family N-acetyltransferase n=1 Tax=Amphritea sp. 1_MG-2023 TaxID=3062670 RepID=UPI0026E39EB9|nr:GNAT family N-acetyltransferase [Amphritea sp. 1_MG-2023]MDO6563997.1 GNAT family N-acetyltransferase [Amphritea sp. 1_MG-2023]